MAAQAILKILRVRSDFIQQTFDPRNEFDLIAAFKVRSTG
jgi:hypothetical protein